MSPSQPRLSKLKRARMALRLLNMITTLLTRERPPTHDAPTLVTTNISFTLAITIFFVKFKFLQEFYYSLSWYINELPFFTN